jgi:hypothetical protein
MNTNPSLLLRTVAGLTILAVVAACGATRTIAPPLPNDISGDMHQLDYDSIAVNVETSFESVQTLGVEGGGQAAKAGFKLMGQAPIGCLGAGMMAGICYAMMPFFPIIAASRAEDPEIAREELASFYSRIEEYDLHEKLESRLIERMAIEKLPILKSEAVASTNRLVTVSVFTSPMRLQHSGYKKGYIEATLPYTVELSDESGQILARKSGKVSEDFIQSSRSVTLYPKLDEWLETIVETTVSRVLLEWQPEVILGYRYPNRVERRTWLGFRYLEWVPVDSLTPRIQWQRLEELVPLERMSDITDVSYELDIYGYTNVDAEQHWKQRIVMKVTDLAEPSYQPESGLLPCQRYYWEAKARFFYRGTMRTTTLPDRYELRTSGAGCKNPRYLLPAAPEMPDSMDGPQARTQTQDCTKRNRNE